MSWNTPEQLSSYIGLQFADFGGGENDTGSGRARFQEALDTAHEIILFRLAVFDEDTSFVERDPFRKSKFDAASTLRTKCEWKKAGAILYSHKSQLALQFGKSGEPTTWPDGHSVGPVTPERNVQASEMENRARVLEQEFEMIMSLIEPRTNLPFVSAAAGRSDFTSDGTYFGSASDGNEWA